MLRLRRTKNWIFLGLTAALVLVQIKLIREVVKQSKIQLIWRTLFEEISHTEQWSSRGVQYAILYCVAPVFSPVHCTEISLFLTASTQ